MMVRNQLDQVRNRTGDFEARAARILAARRQAAATATTTATATATPTTATVPAPRAAIAPLTAAAPPIDTLERMPEGMTGGPADELVPEALGRGGSAEAIVLAALRPALFVMDDAIDLQNAIECDETLLGLVKDNGARLHAVCKGVGRVDLTNHFTLPYAGTGFLIDETLVVTNRHVALVFAERLRSGYRMRKGRFGADMEARLDYCRLLGSTRKVRAEVLEILYIARDEEPDFALLRVERQDDAPKLDLLGGARRPARAGMPVAVVGYPAEDGDRNDRALMDEVFRGQYEVKRLAPGFLTGRQDGEIVLLSDYSSLGGNSGSPLIGLDDGKVLGLHFAGRFMENNYAVAADVIESARAQVMSRVAVSAAAVATAAGQETPTSKGESFAGRNGYDPGFLGDGPLRVAMPGPGRWAQDRAPVEGADDHVLRYRNFSTVQSMSRRMPLWTAVNIDGELARPLKRHGDWKLDGRLKAGHQIDNVLYVNNELDRGHMVRRRDPGWGQYAEQAEADTFHYSNCVPQHEDLNQKDWAGLEDYVLEAAETRGFKVSVFTGPVFRDGDRRLKRQPGAEDVPIPEEFWKVVVMVDDTSGALSATGYVLSHGPMIRKLVEGPFIYGQYKTYQVRIALIAAETGLDFGTLPMADPLGSSLPDEAMFGAVARVVDGPGSLVLRRPAG